MGRVERMVQNICNKGVEQTFYRVGMVADYVYFIFIKPGERTPTILITVIAQFAEGSSNRGSNLDQPGQLVVRRHGSEYPCSLYCQPTPSSALPVHQTLGSRLLEQLVRDPNSS